MFNFFKKKNSKNKVSKVDFDIELTASVLGYEIARSDGSITDSELELILDEVKKISKKAGKTNDEILNIIKIFSQNSVSFYDFINDINKDFSKKDKMSLVQFLFNIAYADKVLEVNEERLIRRIADLIHLKDIEVLRLKDNSKNHYK